MAEGEVFLLIDTGSKSKVLKARHEWKVQTLYDEVAKMMTNDGNFHLIVHGGRPLIRTNYIRDYHLKHNDKITFCQEVPGGGRLTALPGYVRLTSEPCCFTGDDDPSEMRAGMPCGCAISADAMKSMCKTTLDKGEFKFFCPNHRTEWSFVPVRHVLAATMSQKELEAFAERVDANYAKTTQADIRQCFQCNSYSVRDASKPIRVICTYCTKQQGRRYEFCWLCGREWRGEGKCGNANCDASPAERVKILAGCGTKEIGGVSGCPEKRGCQKCGALIEHTKACKHITCRCGYQFCFICLKPLDSKGQWQCGEAYSACPIAARQTSLPM